MRPAHPLLQSEPFPGRQARIPALAGRSGRYRRDAPGNGAVPDTPHLALVVRHVGRLLSVAGGLRQSRPDEGALDRAIYFASVLGVAIYIMYVAML